MVRNFRFISSKWISRSGRFHLLSLGGRHADLCLFISREFVRAFLLSPSFAALIAPVWAQKDAGAIVGLVRDASGAIIAGAQVTIADVDRGTTLTLATNGDGEYVASPLHIGRYTVTVEKDRIQEGDCRTGASERAGSFGC